MYVVNQVYISPADLQGRFGGSYNQYAAYIDACRSGVFPRDMTRGVISSACLPNEYAYESHALQHGVFSNFLIQGLTNSAAGGGGNVTAENLHVYAAPRTRSFTNNMQNPQLKDNYPGSLQLDASISALPLTVSISGPAVLTTNDCGTYSSNVTNGSGSYSYLWKLSGNPVGNSSTFHFCPTFPNVYSLVLEVNDQTYDRFASTQFNITVNDPGVPGPDPPQFVDGTEILQLPDVYAIYSNYPNPFNPITTIRYELPEPSYVTLVIYDMMGREVRRLVNDVVQPGYHTAMWDSRNNTGNVVASGMYLYRFTATPTGGQSEFTGITKSNTMLLVK